MNFFLPKLALPATLCFYLCASSALADVDTLVTVVPSSAAVNGKQMGSFGYNPLTNTFYIGVFSSSAPEIRKVVLDNTGTVTSAVTAVSNGQIQLYYRNGDPDLGVTNPSLGSMLLNPVALDANTPAYSFAAVFDSGLTRLAGTGNITDVNNTKRIYLYNLQTLDQTAPPATTPPYNDGRDVFTTRSTLAQLQTAATATAPSPVTSTSSILNKQPAFSGDGLSLYWNDSSNPTTAYGGIWRIGTLTGNPQRIYAPAASINTEPAVLSSGGIDSIYYSVSTTSPNTTRIEKITYNTATGVTSAPSTVVSTAQLYDFLEVPTGNSVRIFSMASDPQGNLYFGSDASPSSTAPDRRALYQIDTQGRISKVVSYAERVDEFGTGIQAFLFRMTPRTTSYSGPNGTFNVTQMMYAEQGSVNQVSGINVFKTGDFNRDNQLTAADINLLKGIDPTSGVQTRTLVTTRGVLMTANTTPGVGGNSGFTAADYKFDLNGNSVTDWKDIKILQPFFDFGNGDVDLNGVVDFADFQLIQNNYGLTGKTWFSGDLDGNDIVDFADFQILQNSFGYQSSVLTGFSIAAFDQAQWDSFVVAAIPEPSTCVALGGIAIVGLIARRRRTNYQSHCTGVAG